MRDPTLGLPDPGWYGNRAFSVLKGVCHDILSTTGNQ